MAKYNIMKLPKMIPSNIITEFFEKMCAAYTEASAQQDNFQKKQLDLDINPNKENKKQLLTLIKDIVKEDIEKDITVYSWNRKRAWWANKLFKNKEIETIFNILQHQDIENQIEVLSRENNKYKKISNLMHFIKSIK